MSRIRVLLADDHVTTREGLRRLLDEDAAVEVIGVAGDGEETVRQARELRPDILLLDISMPRLNGVEVARALETALPETRIVVLTGYSDSEEYARALLRLGVKGYLSKTASLEEVIDALRSVHAGHTHMEPAISALLASADQPAPEERPTPRELDVLRLVAKGYGNADIAKDLFIVERTVEFHLTNLLGKLQASSRTEAVYLARQKKWLP